MNHEYDIEPDKLPKRRRRTAPPGQNRHRYADQPEVKPVGDEYDDLPDDEPVAPSRSRTRQGERTRRKTHGDVSVVETPGLDKAEPALVRFFYDRRLSLFLGLASLLTSVVMVVLLLSQIKSGALDQTVIMNMTTDEIVKSGTQVHNAVGPFGAWLGNVLFTRALGVGSFILAGYLFILGIGLIRRRRIEFWSLTFKSALLAITLSIFVGLLTFALETPVFWGGVHGHYVNQYLFDYSGWIGCFVVSCLLLAAVASVYLHDITRLYMQWRKRIAARKAALAERAERKKSIDMLSGEEVAEEKPVEAEEPVVQSVVVPEPESEPADAAGFDIDEPKTATPDEPGFSIDSPVIEIDGAGGDVAGPSIAGIGDYDPRADLSHFEFPSLELLDNRPMRQNVDMEEQERNKNRIIKTLGDYNIGISSIKASVGPTVTLYEIVPAEGIRVAQIKRLEDDIALNLAAKDIRIIAPMPGKGTVGIEVPNSEAQTVPMRTVLASKKFRETKAKLPVALGVTISNEVSVVDIAAMPHALVAGSTGMGKSVGLNVIISSLLYKKHPSELKFVLIDPKMVEFSLYARLERHYLAALPDDEDAIVTDPSRVLTVLNSLCTEMDNRYALLKKAGTNKIEDYNNKFVKRRLNPEQGHRYMPYIVVIIDEFADLIMVGGKDIELPVTRITQKARAVGIHMIIATQRPSTNVLTGLIKANCPVRIAFRTQQMVDSRTILDGAGAEKLIGRGDMLYSQSGDMERMQCAFISTDEVEAICDAIDAQTGYERAYPLPEPQLAPEVSGAVAGASMDRDPLFDEAARFTVRQPSASTSSLQRRFEIGYNRAGKIMDQMEAAGIVGPASGSKPRQVLVDSMTLEAIISQR